MPILKPASPAALQVVPAGQLKYLNPDEIKPNAHNPRLLFDPIELAELKSNISEHGVLVPITVYQNKGQNKFSILDGERRYRCVKELTAEGQLGKDNRPLTIPANVVEPPTKVAGLLYMFSIHNIREAWELMPTALGLRIVMEDLGERDNKKLAKLTGLSEPQIERCKKLLAFPEEFQRLSLDPDPKTRVPSNFWIEALPVIDLAMNTVPSLAALGRDRLTWKLVDKYRAKKIKSVIHFRRVMESYDLNRDNDFERGRVERRLEEFFLNPNIEAKAGFDEFVADRKRVQTALGACESFMHQLQQLKLRHTTEADERFNLRAALKVVREYCDSLEQELRGSDDPEALSA